MDLKSSGEGIRRVDYPDMERKPGRDVLSAPPCVGGCNRCLAEGSSRLPQAGLVRESAPGLSSYHIHRSDHHLPSLEFLVTPTASVAKIQHSLA